MCVAAYNAKGVGLLAEVVIVPLRTMSSYKEAGNCQEIFTLAVQEVVGYFEIEAGLTG